MNKQRYDKDQMQKLADKVSERDWKEDFPFEAQRTLHLIQQHDLVGLMMKKAVERGEFDNLEGVGKPLNLKENPFEPDELHMVHKILKDNGFAPYWIELGKEIDARRIKLEKEVDYFKRYTRIVFSQKRSNAAIKQYELRKNGFYNQCREQLLEISKKILDYNLHCPVSQLGRANFDVNEEMNSLIKDIEELIQQ